MNDMADELHFMTVKDANRFLRNHGWRHSLSQTYAAIHRGDLPHLRINGRLMVGPDLESWLRQRAAAQTDQARRRGRRDVSEPPMVAVDLRSADRKIAALIGERKFGERVQ